MFKNSLLLATAFLVVSMSASSHAATMSSDAVDSDIFAPPIALNLAEITGDGEVETQASAYFAPVDENSTIANPDDGFMTVEEEKRKRRRGALAWTSSALALGNFFSYNSQLPAVSVPSAPLGPGAGVAPVPEMNSGMLVLLAMAGLGVMAVGRKQLMRTS